MALATASDGAQLHFETFGTGDEGWIFLHGWGGAAGFWREFLTNHFDLRQRRAISISLRGHGESTSAIGGHSYSQYAADVLTVVQSVGWTKFSLVGFSLGGKIATWLAAKYPDRVNNLALIAPAGPGTLPFERDAVRQLCNSARDLTILEGFFHSWFSPKIDHSTSAAVLATMSATPPAVLLATAEMLAWTSIAADIESLPMPTLVLAGQSDTVYGPEYQRKETLPFLTNPKFNIVQSGHFIPLECPVELASELNDLTCRNAK